MMNRNEEAHAACLNILSDNKDSAPRIAELCTLSRLLGSEVDAITAERDEWKRRLDAVVEMLQPAPDEKLQKMYAEDLHVEYAIRELYPIAIAIAEGRDNANHH